MNIPDYLQKRAIGTPIPSSETPKKIKELEIENRITEIAQKIVTPILNNLNNPNIKKQIRESFINFRAKFCYDYGGFNTTNYPKLEEEIEEFRLNLINTLKDLDESPLTILIEQSRVDRTERVFGKLFETPSLYQPIKQLLSEKKFDEAFDLALSLTLPSEDEKGLILASIYNTLIDTGRIQKANTLVERIEDPELKRHIYSLTIRKLLTKIDASIQEYMYTNGDYAGAFNVAKLIPIETIRNRKIQDLIDETKQDISRRFGYDLREATFIFDQIIDTNIKCQILLLLVDNYGDYNKHAADVLTNRILREDSPFKTSLKKFIVNHFTTENIRWRLSQTPNQHLIGYFLIPMISTYMRNSPSLTQTELLKTYMSVERDTGPLHEISLVGNLEEEAFKEKAIEFILNPYKAENVIWLLSLMDPSTTSHQRTLIHFIDTFIDKEGKKEGETIYASPSALMIAETIQSPQKRAQAIRFIHNPYP